MQKRERYVVQAFQRRAEGLSMAEIYESPDEDAVFRRGRAMQSRVDGLAFFRIETSADGDQWTEVLLSTAGDVPVEDAA